MKASNAASSTHVGPAAHAVGHPFKKGGSGAMSFRLKIAFCLYAIVIVILMAGGMLCASSPQIMPCHLQMINSSGAISTLAFNEGEILTRIPHKKERK
jgi:hypothetical protein